MKLAASLLLALALPAPASATVHITPRYAKRALHHYIERHYEVVHGPGIGRCHQLAANKVRCDVEFRAGLFWRCGRGTVTAVGRYDYIDLVAPIGC
jgi:hypothetical protein